MINFNEVTEKNAQEHNPCWSQISDHRYKMLIVVDGLRSGKSNPLLKLIAHQPDIDKFYMYAKYPSKP